MLVPSCWKLFRNSSRDDWKVGATSVTDPVGSLADVARCCTSHTEPTSFFFAHESVRWDKNYRKNPARIETFEALAIEKNSNCLRRFCCVINCYRICHLIFLVVPVCIDTGGEECGGIGADDNENFMSSRSCASFEGRDDAVGRKTIR
jgi:hypothetical protein